MALLISCMLKSKSIALSIDIFVHIKSLCWKIFRPTPPLVSNCQHLAYPPSSAMVSFWLTPLPPPAGDVICERTLMYVFQQHSFLPTLNESLEGTQVVSSRSSCQMVFHTPGQPGCKMWNSAIRVSKIFWSQPSGALYWLLSRATRASRDDWAESLEQVHKAENIVKVTTREVSASKISKQENVQRNIPKLFL